MKNDDWYKLRNLIFSRQFGDALAVIKRDKDILNARSSIGETVLHYLAVENNQEGVAWLKTHGANVNTQNDFGVPPVFEVAELGYKELLKWFLDNDADLSITDKEGRDIWAYLKESNKSEMIEYLNKIKA